MANIYYNPEIFGLVTLTTVSWNEEAYQYDYTVLWQDASGQIYMGSDSGCSCPSPFDGVTKDKLIKVNSVNDITNAINQYDVDRRPESFMRLIEVFLENRNKRPQVTVPIASHIKTLAREALESYFDAEDAADGYAYNLGDNYWDVRTALGLGKITITWDDDAEGN